MAVTIRDISKRLNVSVSTVSYALNDGPRPVPPEVKEQVLKVAAELGYRPNRIGRMLSTGRTQTIGLVPTAAAIDFATGPYFQSILNGVVNAGEKLRYDVLLFSAYDQSESEFSQTLVDGRVDGLILLAPRSDSDVYRQVVEAKVPFVVVGAEGLPGTVSINCDNRAGIWAAVDHLVELGHKDIAEIAGPKNMPEGEQRSLALHERLAYHGLETRPEWTFDGSFHPDDGRRAFERLQKMDRLPSAIVCANDEMAFGFLRACFANRVQIPEQFSLVGFDDVPLSVQSFPPLTTVRQPLEEMGEAALQRLVELVKGGSPVNSRVFDTQLVVRSSTARPATA